VLLLQPFLRLLSQGSAEHTVALRIKREIFGKLIAIKEEVAGIDGENNKRASTLVFDVKYIRNLLFEEASSPRTKPKYRPLLYSIFSKFKRLAGEDDMDEKNCGLQEKEVIKENDTTLHNNKKRRTTEESDVGVSKKRSKEKAVQVVEESTVNDTDNDNDNDDKKDKHEEEKEDGDRQNQQLKPSLKTRDKKKNGEGKGDNVHVRFSPKVEKRIIPRSGGASTTTTTRKTTTTVKTNKQQRLRPTSLFSSSSKPLVQKKKK